MEHEDDDVFIGAEIDGRRGSTPPRPADDPQPSEAGPHSEDQNRPAPTQTSASDAGR